MISPMKALTTEGTEIFAIYNSKSGILSFVVQLESDG